MDLHALERRAVAAHRGLDPPQRGALLNLPPMKIYLFQWKIVDFYDFPRFLGKSGCQSHPLSQVMCRPILTYPLSPG